MKKQKLFLAVLSLLLLCALCFAACDKEDDAPDGAVTSGTSAAEGETSSHAGTGTEGTAGGTSAGTQENPTVTGSTGGSEEKDPTHICVGKSWVNTKEATCTEDGVKQLLCECGKVVSTQTVAAGHVTVKLAGTAATCTGEGREPYEICQRCEYNTYRAIAPLGHDIVMNDAKDPTCTEVGNAAYETCSRCDYTTYREVPTVEHVYVDLVCKWCHKEYGSQLFAYVSNGNGTCTLAGMGACTDAALEIPCRAPNGEYVTAIAEGAFRGNKEIVRVGFEEGSRVSAIGDGAFEDCTALWEVALPESLLAIGESAFSGCKYLQTVRFAKGCALREIGGSAFKNCRSLSSFTVPAAVERIGDGAFRACFSLVEVYDLSSHLTVTAGEDAVNGLVGLYALTVHTDEAAESLVRTDANGFRFYVKGDVRYLLGHAGGAVELTLPADCDGAGYEVYHHAFYLDKSLVALTIPDCVSAIGTSAFQGCSNLSRVTLSPDGALARLGANAFASCTSLTSFVLPANLTQIRGSAFVGCYALIEIFNFSESLTVKKQDETSHGGVGAYALAVYTDRAAASRVFTDSEGYRFYAEEHTKYLVGYEGTETILTLPTDCRGGSYQIAAYAFYGNTALESVILSEKVTGIGTCAFAKCASLQKVVLSIGTERIEPSAFYECASLASVVFPVDKTVGWWYSASADAVSGTRLKATELSDSATAATYLRDTYRAKYWRFTEPSTESDDPGWSGWY